MTYEKGTKLRCTEDHLVARTDIVRGEQADFVIPTGTVVEIAVEEEGGTSDRIIVSHEGRDILVPLAKFADMIMH